MLISLIPFFLFFTYAQGTCLTTSGDCDGLDTGCDVIQVDQNFTWNDGCISSYSSSNPTLQFVQTNDFILVNISGARGIDSYIPLYFNNGSKVLWSPDDNNSYKSFADMKKVTFEIGSCLQLNEIWLTEGDSLEISKGVTLIDESNNGVNCYDNSILTVFEAELFNSTGFTSGGDSYVNFYSSTVYVKNSMYIKEQSTLFISGTTYFYLTLDLQFFNKNTPTIIDDNSNAFISSLNIGNSLFNIQIGENSTLNITSLSIESKTRSYGFKFNNMSRINVFGDQSVNGFIINVTTTIEGYPLMSFWRFDSDTIGVTSLVINEFSGCIDVFSLGSSYVDIISNLKSLTSYSVYGYSNNQLIKLCSESSQQVKTIYCELNSTVWNTYREDDNGYKIFNAAHCPCVSDDYTECYNHPLVNTLTIKDDNFNVTFDDLIDNLTISTSLTQQQDIKGFFKTIELPNGLKIVLDFSTTKSMLKGESINPNTSIVTDDQIITIETIVDIVELDTNDVTSSSCQLVLSSSINLISDEQLILTSSSSTLTFTNANSISFDVSFKSNSITYLISENGLDIDGSICYYVSFESGSVECLVKSSVTLPDCDIGYYLSTNLTCTKCLSNCERCYETECYLCSDNFYLENGNCVEKETTCEYAKSNECIKCSNDYFIENGRCSSCSSNCISCPNSSTCNVCESSLNNDGNCDSSSENVNVFSNDNIISCNTNYYLNDSECVDCSSTYFNCKECTSTQCIICQDTHELTTNYECIPTHCNDNECTSCEDGYVLDQNGKCSLEIENCLTINHGECLECINGMYPSNEGCIDIPKNCSISSTSSDCLTCSDGYYLNDDLCNECNSTCVTCHNSTYCFECVDGYMLNINNECVDMSEVNANCKTAIPGNSGGCAICNDGYYRDGTTCNLCISNCNKCNNGESCLICESNYFLLNDASECISYDDLTNCETPSQSGCTKCNDSYYLNNQYCISCSDTTENCNTCNNNGECLTCQNDHILINYECINYQLIDNCKESKDSKCTSCSFWHTLNEDQTGCDTQVVWWVIVLTILGLLLILIGICVLIWYIIKLLFVWEKQQKQRKETTIFDMKTSNVQFKSTNNKDVVINKDEILFNDVSEEIGVNEETRDLICVGNTSKHTIKVQFSVKDGCDKYEIRTDPQLITIPKAKAVEFEIFIKPLCTCKINDQIMLISVDLSEGKTITTPITISTQTIMTSRLNYSELIEDMKSGEGSFGIVYKGTFRGNQVAIKKMKQLNNKEQMEEFNKEVQMLDKFRNEYIVHFYGAVFIPNKICMVTEFAQYGSLQDLMNKRKYKPIDNTMKMKILLDCSKGISYLHSNGILHRDIKPDNFLILSLDTNVQVNAKLTDFGSSRNINMMMTNMTFTKGIGTPKYMAPEILDRNKYKKSADIYSFAITMYETIIWDNAFPKSKFEFAWSIADFISNGSRLPKPNTMNDSIYSLITNCWKQEPKERYEIEDVIKKLKQTYF